jgi:ribosomal protein S6--L-glutamate ligase
MSDPMKIAILSRGPSLYSTRRLVEAGRERGHDIDVYNTLSFAVQLKEQQPTVTYAGEPFGEVDAVVPRIGARITFYGTAVVRQFEQMGVFTLSPSHAISVSRDKLRSLQVLSRHGIGMPDTVFVRDREHAPEAIESIGGAPVIVKVLEGTQGVGVILAETDKAAKAIVETLQMAKQNVLIQKFVAESAGRDLRAFVVGGRVVAAIERVAKKGEFRSNVHQGGSANAVTLDPEYEATAIRAAQILGLRVAGVDMLESSSGPKVLEVNSSPGLEGIEKATGVDVAGAVIEHIQDQVLFPEVDVRQRLTLKSGYGVAEIPVGPDSSLAGKEIRGSGLSEREIRILSISRGSVVMPNPPSDTVLTRGDVLLCFGKQLALKSLIPRRKTES